MITFDELIKEHEQLWKDTNLDQQQAKFDEENVEYRDAETEDEQLKELADLIIVCAGMARFDYTLGLGEMVKCIFWSEINIDDIWNAVEKKMEKNRSRTWQKVDGVGYHHIEG